MLYRLIKGFKEEVSKESSICFSLIILLALMNYGAFWLRGGYADDFNFLAYSSGKSYLDVVAGWSANARFSQAVVMPLMMQGLSGDSPTEFNWALFHFVGLMAFVLSILIFNQILKTIGASQILRFTACLMFALHPLKSEAILWPSAIVGYAIALFFFLLATWMYFKKARNEEETIYSLSLVWLLFIFSIFFIEQLVPLLVLVIIVRLIVFRNILQITLLHGVGLVSLLAVFIWVNLFTSSSEKLSRYTGDELSIIINSVNVIYKSAYNILLYPATIVLDSYYWPELEKVLLFSVFWLSLAVLVYALWRVVVKYKPNSLPNASSMISPWYLLAGGAAFWVAAFSPFMVISYYLPARVYFVPLLGFSVMFGAIMELIVSKTNKTGNMVVSTLLFGSFSVFILVNQFSQADFAKQWQDQEQVIHSVMKNENQLNKGDTVNLVNFPKTIGPAPEFINSFAFTGMLNWLTPHLELKGDTQHGVLDNFDVSKLSESKYLNKLNPKDGRLVFLWSDKEGKPIQIKSIFIINKETIDIDTKDMEGKEDVGSVLGKILPLSDKAMNIKGYKISIEQVIVIPRFDLALLKIKIITKDLNSQKIRLTMHAKLLDDSIKPYDRTLTLKNSTWKNNDGSVFTEIQIKDYSQIKAVEVGLIINGGRVGDESVELIF